MNVAVVGTGYVGLVVGACLAETGNHVVGADIDEHRIDLLKAGRIPIYEPGLEPLVVKNTAAGRLTFTTDVGAAVEASDVVFIAVGTPPNEDGSADLHHVLAVARMVGQHMNRSKVVITKSTVPVGTAGRVRAEIEKCTTVPFQVCSNPEFLKEGAALEDFMRPDRVVIGVEGPEAEPVLTELYAPFVRTGNPLLFMDVASAEITKYAANAMLATRISLMNQIAELCEHAGADVGMVRRGIGTDRRIGPAFLFPGPGYGGSCFPKDVRALLRTAREFGLTFDLLAGVEAVNARQRLRLAVKVRDALGGSLKGATVAVWGLAFKAETDDVRESPAIDLIRVLMKDGARVQAHDPAARDTARAVLGDDVQYCETEYDALKGADALVVVTEWLAYRNPDFERMKQLLKRPIIVDGRNLYNPSKLRGLGFSYQGIGLPNKT